MGPGAKLQVTLLNIKGEPTYVDVAGALQDARGDVLTITRRIHQYVGVESGIKSLVRTGKRVAEGNVCAQPFNNVLVRYSSICSMLLITLLPFKLFLSSCLDTTGWQLL